MDKQPTLLDAAKAVLATNDRGAHTVPTSSGLYPHQWLWDSCFVAIGLRHLDIDRAQLELVSLTRGQWANGMLPNIIFNSDHHLLEDRLWRSWLHPCAPADLSTSGITQPPMLAEAVVRVGAKLTKAERRSWYKTMYPHLLDYHQWLYRERDQRGDGLVMQIHPWETGMDNSPPWMEELHTHQLPLWIRIIKNLRLGWIFNVFRRDTRYVPAAQRISMVDALAMFSTQRRLRRKNYDINRIKSSRSLLAIEDVGFNSIFARANQHLKAIAELLNTDLPAGLVANMAKTESALEQLWDPYAGQYFSREFGSQRLLKNPTVGTLLPLYSGAISKERAKQLVKLLEDETMFCATYPAPSVPLSSAWFDPDGYWQGPAWVNTNWLIIDGLKRYGFDDHAAALAESTLEMVEKSGCYEYFNPLDGAPAGAPDFSWTAALTIDLLRSFKQ